MEAQMRGKAGQHVDAMSASLSSDCTDPQNTLEMQSTEDLKYDDLPSYLTVKFASWFSRKS